MMTVRLVGSLALLLHLGMPSAPAVIHTSIQAGSWHESATWGGTIPGTGDAVIVRHSLLITQPVDIGNSTMVRTNVEAALNVMKEGWLTVGTGITLTVRGSVELYSTLALQAGATLAFNAEGAADPEAAHYWMKVIPSGTNFGRLVARGTAAQPCRVAASPANRVSIIGGTNITTVSTNNGLYGYTFAGDGGQMDAEYTIFDSVGDGMFPAWSYRPGSTAGVYRLRDCIFTNCGRVVVNAVAPLNANIVSSFERVRWVNSVPRDPNFAVGGYWGILQTCGATGALTSCRLIQCDVDRTALLWNLSGYTVEDCIFRDIVDTRAFPISIQTFRRNLMRFTANDRLYSSYGSRLEDSLLIHDYETAGNPHYHHTTGGTGTAVLHGCVFWFSSTNVWPDGGDGTFVKNASSGTRDDNELRIEHGLYLPNGRGPDQPANLSCNITSGGLQATNVSVVVRRTTAFSQGVSIGETLTTYRGVVKYVKSNLFVGPTNFSGSKINDFGKGETNAVVTLGADYNSGFRLATGSCYVAGISGKGYDKLKLSPDNIAIGAHDLDDVDPQFVNMNRNPHTWSQSLGGGANMTDVMNLLRPTGTNTIQNLLEYLREGFRPQNPRLKRAGDPADGSPDIGAVDLAADSDGDGIPDDHEFGHHAYQIGVDDRTVDSDGDRVFNADEYVAGTDATRDTDFFAISATNGSAGSVISFASVSGHLYEVSYKTNLLAAKWTRMDAVVTGTNDRLSVVDPDPSEGNRYYCGHVKRP